MIVLDKTYDGESIIDMSRDVAESFESLYNPCMNAIPVDEYGFMQGSFKLTITWTNEDGPTT